MPSWVVWLVGDTITYECHPMREDLHRTRCPKKTAWWEVVAGKLGLRGTDSSVQSWWLHVHAFSSSGCFCLCRGHPNFQHQPLSTQKLSKYPQVQHGHCTQEQRLGQHGAVRRGAGYDMSDPFMVATSEMDFAGGKRRWS